MTKEEEKAALQQIWKSAAPGQWDLLQFPLQEVHAKAKNVPADVLSEVKAQHQASFGVGVGINHTNISDFATDLQTLYEQYLHKAFSGPDGRGGVKKITTRVWTTKGGGKAQAPECQDNDFHLMALAEKLDSQNMNTAHWKSMWTISHQNTSIQGQIHLHSYAYEDGNTQMQMSKQFEPKTMDSTKAMLQQIVEWEHQMLNTLRGLQEEGMIPDQLKHIRRVLPITKTKMNWEVEAQRGVQYLKKTAQKFNR